MNKEWNYIYTQQQRMKFIQRTRNNNFFLLIRQYFLRVNEQNFKGDGQLIEIYTEKIRFDF